MIPIVVLVRFHTAVNSELRLELAVSSTFGELALLVLLATALSQAPWIRAFLVR